MWLEASLSRRYIGPGKCLCVLVPHRSRETEANVEPVGQMIAMWGLRMLNYGVGYISRDRLSSLHAPGVSGPSFHQVTLVALALSSIDLVFGCN